MIEEKGLKNLCGSTKTAKRKILLDHFSRSNLRALNKRNTPKNFFIILSDKETAILITKGEK
jgi:hypothetical protein